jgi:hypothetical protein
LGGSAAIAPKGLPNNFQIVLGERIDCKEFVARVTFQRVLVEKCKTNVSPQF